MAQTNTSRGILEYDSHIRLLAAVVARAQDDRAGLNTSYGADCHVLPEHSTRQCARDFLTELHRLVAIADNPDSGELAHLVIQTMTTPYNKYVLREPGEYGDDS